MQATSTLDHPEAPPAANSRTFGRAFEDITTAWKHRELWGHLGWQDIKQRYRRSVIGPLWITISMGTTALALGLLYSQLFQEDIATFLPYVTVGFVIWGFILGCVNEGTEVFIANEGLIKHLPAPITVHVLRLVWRQTLFFAHNLVVYVVVLAIFFSTLSNPYVMNNDPELKPGVELGDPAGDPGLRPAGDQRRVDLAAVRHHQHPVPRHPAGRAQLHQPGVLHDADRLARGCAQQGHRRPGQLARC